MKLSLFFFSADGAGSHQSKYRLVMEAAKFADTNGFEAIWTPERHFSAFGGLYPNPSVMAAAIAAITGRIGIRAGSVILPLQDPLRVAEEWSVVDNLSNGRVAISVGRGWNINDFVLAPEAYARSREAMYEHLLTVQRLWRGEAVSRRNGGGEQIEIVTYPRPVQKDLPIWISVESEESFVRAGVIGANVLTHLLLKSVDDLRRGIRLFHESLAKHGVDPNSRQVTLMMHTFLTHSSEHAYQRVDEAYSQYIENYLDFRGSAHFNKTSSEDVSFLKARALDRLFATNGLVGTVDDCMDRIVNLEACGVTEIACLIDFGIPTEEVLDSLNQLVKLQSEIA